MLRETRNAVCYSFSSVSSLPEDVLQELERMRAHAYAAFAASPGDLWSPDKFRQKLASYGHVACVLERLTQTPRCFLAYSSPAYIGQTATLKAGPLGFAADVGASWQKVALLRGLIAAFEERFPHSILWAELPSQPSVLEKLLGRQGYTACDSITLAEALLESAEVSLVSMELKQGVVRYETATKKYPQKILLRYPSVPQIVLTASIESTSAGAFVCPETESL